jgi:hypothetical protein
LVCISPNRMPGNKIENSNKMSIAMH